MAFSDTVKRVSDLTMAIENYWDTELPKRHPSYPIVGEGEDDVPPPPEEAELRALLRSLPAEDVYKLVALIRLGQGRYPASEFPRRWRQLIAEDEGTEDAMSYIADRGFLAADLSDGVKALSTAGIDIDAVQPAPV